MNIWVINAQEPPPLSKTIKGRRLWRSNYLCEILSKRGHNVLMWRSSFSHEGKKQLTNYSIIQTNQ